MEQSQAKLDGLEPFYGCNKRVVYNANAERQKKRIKNLIQLVTMKLENEFKNFKPALLFYLEDKNPILGSNNSKNLCYFLSLQNLKNTFDYYDLVRNDNNGVYFRIYTMKGFKQIAETNSKTFHNDLEIGEWQNIIYEISMSHFLKEEYLALKNGYTKTSSGCLTVILVFLILNYYIFLN